MNILLACPSISVVMPSFNQAHYIGKSIQSILSQKYPKLELIVIDGGSTDNTVDILKKSEGPLRWVSEKDNGQADALNKGFRMATGDIIGWLNADDLYEPDTLSTVGQFFDKNPNTMWAFGHCSIIDAEGAEIRKWISWYKRLRLRHYSYHQLLSENFISQMGVFMRRSAIEQVGGVDPSRHYVMDYDLWLRLGKRFEPGLIDTNLGRFRMYDTTKSMTGFRSQFAEGLEVAAKYANGSQWPIVMHKLNNIKIVTIYELMAWFRRLKVRSQS